MASLLTAVTLIDTVQFQTPGCPDTSPSACVLSDGTFLVAVALNTGTGVTHEEAHVWHLDETGGVLGEYAYDDAAAFKDVALCAVDDVHAVMLVNASGTMHSIVLDCTAHTPVPVSFALPSTAIDFTNTDGGRFSVFTNGVAVIHGRNGIMVLDPASAAQIGAVTFAGRTVWGWSVNPANSAEVNVIYRGSPGSHTYTVGSSGISDGGLLYTVVENWWVFGVGSNFDTVQPVMEGNDDQGFDVRDRTTSVALGSKTGTPNWYLNVNGPASGYLPGSMVAVYEWDSTDADGNWHPAVMEVTVAGPTSATLQETVLNWGTTTLAVSLTYGSFTYDIGNGKMILAAASTSRGLPISHYSLTVYLLKVGAAGGVLKVLDDNHEWRKVGLSAPESDEGRLKVWTDAYGWTWEWFPSDGGDLRKWPLKMWDGTSWVTVATMTNGQHT